MTELEDRKASELLGWLNEIASNFSYERICYLGDEQKQKYAELLSVFKDMNCKGAAVSHSAKGKALEELVTYLLEISGGIFEVVRNLRTSTNEIDQLVSLNTSGRVLLANNIIDNRLGKFLCECKNYNKTVSVTYVGKFCSLLLSNQVKLGILFSYHGISGSGWTAGSGLVKKFYLSKENLSERYCIVDFSVKEFESILQGNNLLQIIEDQLTALQFDTDYRKWIARHPAET